MWHEMKQKYMDSIYILEYKMAINAVHVRIVEINNNK